MISKNKCLYIDYKKGRKKKMKKIFNYLVALALVFVQLLPVANAASITIDKSVKGQVYNAYKIFDVTRVGNSYAYSIESTNDWFAVVEDYAEEKETITLTQVGDTTKYVVDASKVDAADFAAYLNEHKEGKTVTGTATAEGTTTTITVSEAGYYFVDSSLGALCILHTAADTFTIEEKNAEPTIKKEVSQESASVGDTITFTITVTAGGKADTSYILHDKMTEGLDLNATSFTIKTGETVVSEENYEIKTGDKVKDGCTFEIEFNKAYTATLEKNTVITVTYTATVNEKAIVKSEVTNEATLQYGNTYSPKTEVTVVNFDFDIVKTNEAKEQLSGAKFKLYDAKTNGNEIKLIKDGEFYRPIKAGETAVEYIEAGSASIKGLEKGTYYLEEIEAPVGYNQLTERVAVQLNADLTLDNAIKVVNTTGSQLPHTGGMGTVLFITIGSIMVLGFGVLLVTKLRISRMYI